MIKLTCLLTYLIAIFLIILGVGCQVNSGVTTAKLGYISVMPKCIG